MRITAGLMTSNYSCLLWRLLCFAVHRLRGSPELAQRVKQRNGGPVVFAGQKPYPTWRQSLPPPNDSVSDPIATAPVSADLKSVFAGARRTPVLPIVLGISLVLAALIPVGLLIILMLRPAATPKIAAPLPALVALPPPLLDSASQTMESDRLLAIESRPIQFGAPPQESLEATPPPDSTTIIRPSPLSPDRAPPIVLAPLPPPRPLESPPPPRSLEVAPATRPLEVTPPPFKPGTAYDQWTAVYDISARTVYLPDGTRLEAHSGLGDRIDDPRYVNERDHGATPPGVYHLTLRESLFHGVQALRLNPIGGGFTFNRVGLLAHPYMLGPNGDSNGCVSFKTYDAFLRAFQSGEVKRLAVVAEWTGRPHQFGLFASLR
jgi:hypothetical protein